MDLTGLMAFWGLDETSTGSNRGDRHSTNTLTDGLANTGSTTGLVYSAAADMVKATNNVLFSNNSTVFQMGNIDFTICAWVKFTSLLSFMSIVSKGINTDLSYRLAFDEGTGHLFMTVWGSSGLGNGATAQTTTFGTPSTSAWCFIEGGYDATNNQSFIGVNAGAHDVSGAQTLGAWVETDEFDLGFTNGDAATWLDAKLGPVMLWKRLLASSEVTQLYNSGAGLTYAAMQSSSGTGGGCIVALLGTTL